MKFKTPDLGTIIDLKGSGPFQMPLMRCIGLEPGHDQGWFWLRCQTEAGTIVHLPLDSRDAPKLGTALLGLEALRQHKKAHEQKPPTKS